MILSARLKVSPRYVKGVYDHSNTAAIAQLKTRLLRLLGYNLQCLLRSSIWLFTILSTLTSDSLLGKAFRGGVRGCFLPIYGRRLRVQKHKLVKKNSKLGADYIFADF